MQKVLTDALLRATKAPKKGRLELSDLRCAGLTFRVTDKGARSWSFRFRDPLSGDPARYTIGNYPAVSLGGARAKADDLRKEVGAGRNPVEAKRQARVDAPDKTFRALSVRYMDEHAKRKKRSWKRDQDNLNLHVLPKWENRAYLAITRGDVIELIEGLIKADKSTLANRVQSLISGVFSFAIDAGLLSANPCTRLRKRGAERTKDRVLADHEIQWFWQSVAMPPLTRRLGLGLRLTLLTGCRVNEVAGISRSELTAIHDEARAEWLIPAERVKQRKEKKGAPRSHLVPLCPEARAIILELLAEIAPETEWLIPNRGRSGPIKGHALTNAMTGIGMRKDAPASWKAERPTAHDLRRTVETRLSSIGIPKEDRDAVLNHMASDVGSRHYDRYNRVAEKRRALTLWGAHLEAISTGRTLTADILPMLRRSAE